MIVSPSSYNPYDGPNEHPEAELPLVAGKYLYVYGDMDDDGFYEGEKSNKASQAKSRDTLSDTHVQCSTVIIPPVVLQQRFPSMYSISLHCGLCIAGSPSLSLSC